MSSFNLLNIGNQALRTNQSALATIGQNISNVNSPGYSRQTTDITSLPDRTGAKVDSVSRITDRFLTEQMWGDLSAYQHTLTYAGLSSDLDNLLATQVTSVSDGLDNYFKAMQNVVDDPVSIPNRELLIAESDALVKRFNDLDRHIEQQSDTINARVEDLSHQVNTISRGIADLNDAIRIANASNDPANELRDQREELVNNLSNLIGVKVVEQGEEFNIFIGNGQPLITGQTANKLAAVQGNPDYRQSDLQLVVSGNAVDVTEELSGGQIGGLLQYREEALNDARDELGRIAIGVAASMNEAHKNGIDLNNDFGKNFFTDINADSVQRGRIHADANNQSVISQMRVEIQDVGQLEASDYELIYENDRQITLIRNSDGKQFTINQLQDVGADRTIDANLLNWGGNTAPVVDGDGSTVPSAPLTPVVNGIAGGATVVNSAQGMADFMNSQPGLSGVTAETAINISGVTEAGGDGVSFDLKINDATCTTQTITVNLPTGATSNDNVATAINAALTAETSANGTDFSNLQLSEADGGVKLLDRTGGNITVDASGGANADIIGIQNYAANGSLVAGGPVNVQADLAGSDTGTVVGYLTNAQAEADSSVDSFSISSPGGALIGGTSPAVLVDGSNNVASLASDTTSNIAALDQGEYYLDPDRGTLAFAVDGFKVVIDTTQQLVRGDRYLIQPVRTGAEDLGLEIQDGKQLALASPIRITSDNTNQGTGVATAKVTNPDALAFAQPATLTPPVDIVFNGGQPTTYNLYDMSNPDNPTLLSIDGVLQSNRAYVPGGEIALDGYSVTISNGPEAGDRFSFTFNKDGVSDNRNAIELSDLQNADVFNDGSYQDLYGSLVERVGTRTATNNITVEANKSVLNSTTSAKAGVAGVNLDEEAAKLVQYQMAYQASAQLISTSQTVFDTLLNSI